MMLETLEESCSGAIVLANIKQALANGDIPPKDVEKFLKACQDHLTKQNKEFSVNDVLNVMEKKIKNKEFTLKGKKLKTSKDISTIMHWSFAVEMMNPTIRSRHTIPAIQNKVQPKHYQNFVEAANESNFFSKKVCIGDKKRGFFWATIRDDVNALRTECEKNGVNFANRIRDILGLIHFIPKACLVEIQIEAKSVKKMTLPTFIEAGKHLRFKARSSSSTSDFGQTCDLGKTCPPNENNDHHGLPEAVVECISLEQPHRLQLKIVGCVKTLPEGRTNMDDPKEQESHDCHFLKLIAGSYEGSLAEAIKKVININ
ncbi:MAG: hypothetical protein H7839_09140 [Magnetococcus sp. YQC-5]